ncbi:unnamed protein product [Chironomus riparius]|uniref:RNA helicase n=1 Tax=Chironomus riparius TaxID=315576 RepID=A0A9N9RTM8_9DIPT|nr:unnamed protein product [Chironomus riparius]
MFSLVYQYLFEKRPENIKKFEDEKRRKFDELIDELMRKDDENSDITGSEQHPDDSEINIAELSWKCTKNEGIVTSLNDKFGVINEKHEFPKIKALDFWSIIKVGSKVSYLLFENTVASMKLIDAGWEEDYNKNNVIPKNTFKEGYKTELRTVLGTIDEINDNIITVDIGNTKEYVPIDETSEWIFAEGDNVRLDCIITEDETTWNPSIGTFGNIVEIKKITPNSINNDIGRVTATAGDYAIFDESIILNYSHFNKQKIVDLWDEFEYLAIETSIFRDGRNFNWRITKLIKKIEDNSDRQIDSTKKIQMNDEFFELRQNSRVITKFTTIFNNSDQKITIFKCEITANSGLIELQKPDKKFELKPCNGAYKVFMNICPKQYGIFAEELNVDFGTFKKKSLIKFQISRSMSVNRNRFGRFNTGNEIIPGQKIKSAPRFIEIRIPEYPVPDQFRHNFDFKKQTQLLVHDFTLHDHRFLIEELIEQNYYAKMRYCLYLEEIAMEIYFERYRIDRAHFDNKEEFLRLEVEGINEKRPSIAMGDKILASDPFSAKTNNTYEGFIHKVEQNAVLSKFHSEFHHSHGRRDFRIDFHFSRTSFKRQQFALDQVLSSNGLGLNFLFPRLVNIKKNPQLDVKLSENGNILLNQNESEFFNKSLNVYQKTALINVLRGESRPLPYIIYGPPGTGKTRTVVECIKQISSKISWSRIIIATPSNSAANLIVENLVESGIFKGGDFIRFVSYNQIDRDAIPNNLKKYCATIDIGYDKGDASNFMTNESGMMMNASKSIIVKYRIYISTLSTLGPLMHIKFLRDHFTHVIIDEAGQSVEPETLIPISFLCQNKGQVILAGDPQQLGPVLISQVSKFCGFEKSFLERLSEHKYYLPIYGEKKDQFDEKFVTKLKKNYRSLPSILNVYSHLFYNNDLEAEVNDEKSPEMNILKSIDSLLWNRNTANKKCGAFFVNVSGRNLKTSDSSSWFNNEEASRIFYFICKLKNLGISLKNVGIITPYALQVKNLKKIINESMPDSEIKIGSVEEFQGQERDIILISTVRTNKGLIATDQRFGLGFLQCSKRMNVAISRARAVLIVFGKESLLAQDENWRYYIQYTKENGTYVTEKVANSDNN